MIFYSSRKFKVWAYTVSHSSLLVRSYLQFEDEEGYSEETSYNIDLEFWAVSYINLPSKFNEINLKAITEKELPSDIDRDLLKYNMKIFEVQSQEYKYYIIAGGLLIAKNRWANQDRIFDYSSNLEHDEIIFES